MKTPKADYSQMTQDEFDSLRDDIATTRGVAWLMSLPGVAEIVQEELNNDILERWEQENPEKAFAQEQESEE